MKKLVLAMAVAAGLALGAQARVSNARTPRVSVVQAGEDGYVLSDTGDRAWTPVMLTLWSPAEVPWGGCDVKGLRLGLLYSEVENLSGIDIGCVCNVTDEFKGIQIGLLNFSTGRGYGGQVGLYNYGAELQGFQIGLINVSHYMSGCQLGLVNVIEESNINFMPIFNFSF